MIYYIENTVDEYRSKIMGYFPTLKEAVKVMPECSDWWCKPGTGRIYQTEFGLHAKRTLVWENGVYLDKKLIPELTNRQLDEKRSEMSVITKCEALEYIGSKCTKFSGKRFKDGSIINTIKDVGYINANDGTKKLAFQMAENDSYVPCNMVYIID